MPDFAAGPAVIILQVLSLTLLNDFPAGTHKLRNGNDSVKCRPGRHDEDPTETIRCRWLPRAQLLWLLLVFLQRWVAAVVTIWSWSHLRAANLFANCLSLFRKYPIIPPVCCDCVVAPVFPPIGSDDVSYLRMLVCWFACNCSGNVSLCLCVCVCVIWLMVVLVEAELLWLQP